MDRAARPRGRVVEGSGALKSEAPGERAAGRSRAVSPPSRAAWNRRVRGAVAFRAMRARSDPRRDAGPQPISWSWAPSESTLRRTAPLVVEAGPSHVARGEPVRAAVGSRPRAPADHSSWVAPVAVKVDHTDMHGEHPYGTATWSTPTPRGSHRPPKRASGRADPSLAVPGSSVKGCRAKSSVRS